MATPRNKRPRTKKNQAGAENPPAADPERWTPPPVQAGEPVYALRPTGRHPDKSLDEPLNEEWDPEIPQFFNRLESEDDLEAALVDDGISGADAFRADAYQRVSPDEFDEFDSMMDEDSHPVETRSPQLRLLEAAEVDEIERIFEPNAAAQPEFEPAADPEEAMTPKDSQSKMQNPSLFPTAVDEPPPNFDDKGMGAGFYVPEDALQGEDDVVIPEEAEYAPPAENTTPAPPPPANFGSDLYFPPGPTIEIQLPPPIAGDLPGDVSIVEREITEDRVSKMMYRAEMARRRINDEIDSIDLARNLLEQIRSATTLILSGKDKYEEAERSLNEVEYRLSYSRRVKVWSEKIAYPLLAYEVAWLLFMGLGALFIPTALTSAITRINGFSPNGLPDFIQFDDLFLGVSTALWGGLGGVVGALYALWRHVSLKQDFNPQHKMWYYTQPIMGIPIGVVVFLLVRIGIGFTIEGVLDIASPYAIYMMAWIAGFQQTILYEIIRQILKLFRVGR